MQNPDLLELTASEPLSLKEEYEMQKSWHLDAEKLTFLLIDRQNGKLCGDVNLFIQPDFDDLGLKIAELEVMVAEQESRRKGIALEALKILMLYAVNRLDMNLFVVHILKDNLKSKVLFEEKLAFHVEQFQEWSGEWILNKRVHDDWINQLHSELGYLEEKFIDWDGDEEKDPLQHAQNQDQYQEGDKREET